MKIVENVKNNFKEMKNNIKRFPITLIYGLVLGILLIYLNETSYDNSIYKNLERLSMTLFLGTIVSLVIGLFLESLEEKKQTGYILYIVEVGALYFYYKYILLDLGFINGTKYTGFIFMALVAMFFVARINNRENYDLYASHIIKSGAVSFINSIVLYLGLVFILFTLETLFNINIKGNLYFNIYIIIFTTIFLSLYTSKIPRHDENYENMTISLVLEKLLSYIVIPLIFIYSGILYAFFIKILFTREWPHGMVAHLVLWYSLIGAGSLFFIRSVKDKSKWTQYFRKYHPLINIPTIILLFVAVYIRVNQHGFTINRYLVLLGGIWVLLMDIYYILKRDEKNIIMPASLFLAALLFLVGPINAFRVSLKSQSKRLESLLVENEILLDGKLRPNKNVSKEARMEISNKLDYLNKYEFKNIKFLPDKFTIESMDDYFGFEFKPSYYGESTDYYYYHREGLMEGIDIAGYEHIRAIGFYGDGDEIQIFEDLKIRARLGYILEIDRAGKKTSLDFKEIFKYEKIKDKTNDDVIPYEIEIDDHKYKFIIRDLSGSIENDSLDIDALELIVLIK